MRTTQPQARLGVQVLRERTRELAQRRWFEQTAGQTAGSGAPLPLQCPQRQRLAIIRRRQQGRPRGIEWVQGSRDWVQQGGRLRVHVLLKKEVALVMGERHQRSNGRQQADRLGERRAQQRGWRARGGFGDAGGSHGAGVPLWLGYFKAVGEARGLFEEQKVRATRGDHHLSSEAQRRRWWRGLGGRLGFELSAYLGFFGVERLLRVRVERVG